MIISVVVAVIILLSSFAIYATIHDAAGGGGSSGSLPGDKYKGKYQKILAFVGGGGGNRNRVRKSLPATFYERIRYINIPSVKCLTTGV